jgi:anti-anti-sigma factor
MRLQFAELGDNIRLIKLSGALDSYGVSDVEVDFVRLCTGENICVLVDLSKVNYLSSMGIPLLINSAKSIARQGGKMALLNPRKTVENVLDITGIPLIIPIYPDIRSATAALAGSKKS